MVSIEQVADDDDQQPAASAERLLDANELEGLLPQITRPSLALQLESLVKKLRKESEALKRVEASKSAATTATSENANVESKAASPTTVASPTTPAAVDKAPVVKPATTPATPPPKSTLQQYHSIDKFSFDSGGYNSAFVTLYVPVPGVGLIPRDQVKCNFTKSSFDLVVNNLASNSSNTKKSYRLFKDNLEKPIDPQKCKIIVKADEIRIKLAKVKSSDYGGYDYWTKLVGSSDANDKKKKDDPQASIMNLMKDMYDSGDDNMRKMIGETMMKQQRGELGKDDIGSGGMGKFGGL